MQRRALLTLVLMACATARPLHGQCAQTADCSPGAVCMRCATEGAEGHTCELPCRATADSPLPLYCGDRFDGPKRACFEPFADVPEWFGGDGGSRPRLRDCDDALVREAPLPDAGPVPCLRTNAKVLGDYPAEAGD